jgi:hypothetical protein
LCKYIKKSKELNTFDRKLKQLVKIYVVKQHKLQSS